MLHPQDKCLLLHWGIRGRGSRASGVEWAGQGARSIVQGVAEVRLRRGDSPHRPMVMKHLPWLKSKLALYFVVKLAHRSEKRLPKRPTDTGCAEHLYLLS